jgi:hypothetical protein
MKSFKEVLLEAEKFPHKKGDDVSFLHHDGKRTVTGTFKGHKSKDGYKYAVVSSSEADHWVPPHWLKASTTK